jgi:hypothetical protein
MNTLWQDLRYGARMLLRQPGFTLIVLLTLALGIGANTAIFSVVNAVMLRQSPFTDADRLVRLYERNLERGWPDFGVSHPNFLDWRAQSRSFAGMGALTGASFNLNAGGEVEVIRGARITADLLTVLGVQPACAGREHRYCWLIRPNDSYVGSGASERNGDRRVFSRGSPSHHAPRRRRLMPAAVA